MGKAKKTKQNKRFNPLARGNAMAVDDADAEPPKQLSAHQQRHLERKTLKAEAEALKNQRRKVSKANKFQCKKEKKALSASIREKVLRANDKSSILQRPAPAPEPAAAAPTLPTNFMFSLPTPAGAGAKSMQTDAHRLVES
tara:strand:+ start:2745 stop:3167 length:423 start_codon:yes stop_codon:yes gene_type:complete